MKILPNNRYELCHGCITILVVVAYGSWLLSIVEYFDYRWWSAPLNVISLIGLAILSLYSLKVCRAYAIEGLVHATIIIGLQYLIPHWSVFR